MDEFVALARALRDARDDSEKCDAPELRVALRDILDGEIGLDLPDVLEEI